MLNSQKSEKEAGKLNSPDKTVKTEEKDEVRISNSFGIYS